MGRGRERSRGSGLLEVGACREKLGGMGARVRGGGPRDPGSPIAPGVSSDLSSVTGDSPEVLGSRWGPGRREMEEKLEEAGRESGKQANWNVCFLPANPEASQKTERRRG